MAANSAKFVFFVVCLLACCALPQYVALKRIRQYLTPHCLDCICKTQSCGGSRHCDAAYCGPFSISYEYWKDSGKPTLNGELPSAEGAWKRCVNEWSCATETIHRYMNRFAQDCNGDTYIDCDDYVRIHRNGGYHCTNTVNPILLSRYSTCVLTKGK